MEYRKLGRSGLQLSVLSFGSWVTFHKQIDDSVADELMGIAYDQGVNFFDNAEAYALGESEKMMGRVLKKKNWDRTLSTTVESEKKSTWRVRGYSTYGESPCTIIIYGAVSLAFTSPFFRLEAG